MYTLRTLENDLASRYGRLPHMPRDVRKWVAVNLWWIVLVIAILSSIAVLAAIPNIFATAGLSSYSSIYAYRSVPVDTLVTGASISVGFGTVSALIFYLAVKPLRVMRPLGWRLLFINEFVSVLAAVISFIVLIQQFNLWSLAWSLIIVAIELYVLFEVRSEFEPKKKRRLRSNARTAKVVATSSRKRTSKR